MSENVTKPLLGVAIAGLFGDLRDDDNRNDEPTNRPQDGRVCDCEDAPCCGHYES